MRIVRSLAITTALVAVSAAAWAAQDIAPLSNPPGFTFQIIRVGDSVSVPGSSSSQKGQQTVIATAAGMTVYVSDKDQMGKSACAADCTKTWAPVAAAADAVPVGEWSVATRDDGAKQWAFKGKPIYTNVQDKAVGDSKGNGADGDQWHAVSPAPADTALPLGINIQEIADANGQALVDERHMPLYAFDGDVHKDAPANCAAAAVCTYAWKIVAAPMLAVPLGDFSVVNRRDGVKQWAYKGKALYTYTADVELGDATGRSIDKRMQVATLLRYFMPANVAVRSNPQHGGILVTAEGKTLYARDQLRYMGLGNHSARGGAKGVAQIGTAVGTTGCDADCLKAWVPLAAPADAQASGNWSVLTRADGSKQWAYQSYALYSYAADKPGEINGHDEYDMFIVNDDNKKLAPVNHRFGLYWRVATQ